MQAGEGAVHRVTGAVQQAVRVQQHGLAGLGAELDTRRLPAGQHAERRGQRRLHELGASLADHQRRAVPGPGQDDLAQGGLAVREEGGGAARGLGQPEQQLQIGQDGDGVLALHHRVRPQAGSEPAHRGDGARPGAGDGADGEAERALGQRQRVVPVAAASRARAAPGGELDARDPREPRRQQLLRDGAGLGARPLQFEQAREVFGGVTRVQTDQMALAFHGLGGLVVEPHRGAEPARRLRREGQREARRVAEPGGDLAVTRVEAVLGQQIRVHLGLAGPVRAVEDLAVRGRAARHRLDVAEVGAGEAEPHGGVGAQAVGGLQDDESAARADECGTGAEHLVQGVVHDSRPGQALGEFVQRGEVGDPAGEPVLDQRSGGSGGSGRSGGGRGRG